MDAKILDQVTASTVGNCNMKLFTDVSFTGGSPRTFQTGFTPKIVMFPWFSKMQGDTSESPYNYRSYAVTKWENNSVTIKVTDDTTGVNFAILG